MQRIGRYDLIGHLGDGGMGSVYQARDAGSCALVALKVLHPHLRRDAEVSARFRAEAAIQARLRHAHIVQVLGLIDDGAVLAMVEEFVAGSSLDAIVRAGGPQRVGWSVRVVDQVAAALDHAHGQGLIHRDVKPSNILVDGGDRGPFAKLTDFGIAKVLGAAQHLTTTGARLGTLPYMAPEYFVAPDAIDARADIYALGAVLFEVLTGRPALVADTDYQVVDRILHAPIPRPSLCAAGVPAALDGVVARAMAKRPGDRFASCADLRGALAEAVGVPTTAVRVARPATASARASAPAWLALAGGALIVAAIGVAVLPGQGGSNAGDDRVQPRDRAQASRPASTPGTAASPARSTWLGPARDATRDLAQAAPDDPGTGRATWVGAAPLTPPDPAAGQATPPTGLGAVGPVTIPDVTPGSSMPSSRPGPTHVTVAAGIALSLRLVGALASDTATRFDRVEAVVETPVHVDGHLVVAAGTRAIGMVRDVAPGGRFTARARLSIGFDQLVMPDGQSLAIATAPLVFEGEAPGGMARTAGGAVGGAVIGSLLGRKREVAVGAVAGAIAGAAAGASADRRIVRLDAGTTLGVQLTSPFSVQVPGGR